MIWGSPRRLTGGAGIVLLQLPLQHILLNINIDLTKLRSKLAASHGDVQWTVTMFMCMYIYIYIYIYIHIYIYIYIYIHIIYIYIYIYNIYIYVCVCDSIMIFLIINISCYKNMLLAMTGVVDGMAGGANPQHGPLPRPSPGALHFAPSSLKENCEMAFVPARA